MAQDHASAIQSDLPTPRSVPMAGARRSRWAWLDERLGVSALSYPVPPHANSIWFTLGGITFVSFLILIATGIYLAQYFHPHPAEARDSVLYIRNVAPLGDLVRGVHVWTASIVTATAFLHMLRVFATASFKRPREANWLVGVGLLGITVGFVYTGTVLRWDQESWEALQHNTEIANLLGNLGTWFTPEFTRSTPVLERLYFTHVSLLPVFLILFLVAHFFLIKKHGIAPLPAQADTGEAPAGVLPKGRQSGRYTDHLRKMFGYGLVLLAAAGILAVLFPIAIGAPADPTMEVTKPFWMFYWLYSFEDFFNVKGILYAAIAFFGLLSLTPFVDRSPWRSPRRRQVALAIGVVVVLVMVALSVYVWVTPTESHLEESARLLWKV